jgi:hypothetical protein
VSFLPVPPQHLVGKGFASFILFIAQGMVLCVL